MKRSDNGSNDLDHVSKLPRWIGIAGAIFLVLVGKTHSDSKFVRPVFRMHDISTMHTHR